MKKLSPTFLILLALVFLFASSQPVSAGSGNKYSKQEEEQVRVKIVRDSHNTIRPMPLADDKPINPVAKPKKKSPEKHKQDHRTEKRSKKKVRRR
ncbi:MAG: hypothetical protein JW768_11740 [Chitinispirillaceae bacterium]|nr:hypothetical protein [Chitinispirillaceae bacterium]